MKHIKGPDFPTGGAILGRQGIREAYETGRGRVRVRALAHIEPLSHGKEAIIVTELPYMVKKGGDGGLIEKIADLVREKKISEISDLRDESDRNGMRLVIELKRDAIPKVVLNKLYKHTPMQSTFGVNMVALVDGVPRTLNLREVIHHYVAAPARGHRPAHEARLRVKEAAPHILEGLLIAIDNLDAVIELIRGSRDRDAARAGLVERFELSVIQAEAILALRLSQLTALETDDIKQEHADVTERIAELRAILGDEQRVLDLIKEELARDRRALRATTAARRSRPSEDEIDIEDLIADQQMVITITKTGYIKSLPLATYRQQHRGGVGVTGMDMKDGDFIEHLFICSTHDYLLFFTNRGKVYRSKVYELPEAPAHGEGPRARQHPAAARGRARPVGALDARLQRVEVPRVRDPQGHDQEDRAAGLQHADQGRRHHRDQHPRRRRAGRRAQRRPGRHDHHGLALGPGVALRGVQGPRDGPRHRRRARHERLAEGQRGARDGRRPRPTRTCSS